MELHHEPSRFFSTGPCPLERGNPPREMERFISEPKKKENAAFGSRGTTNGTGVFTYKTHLLNNPDLREIDHTLGIWIIDFDDE